MKSNPVMVAGRIAGGIAAAVGLLVGAYLAMAVSLGWWNLTPEQVNDVNGFAVALIGLVALIVLIASPLVTAWYATKKVTPLADPRAPDGEELTRGDGSPALKERE